MTQFQENEFRIKGLGKPLKILMKPLYVFFFQKGAFFIIALQKLNIKDTVSYKIVGAMSLSSQVQYWLILCSKN